MNAPPQKRKRRKRLRSYRRLKLFLFALGVAGVALGCLMVVVFGVRGNWHVAELGLVYILAALGLLGVRGLVSYVDQQRKQKRSISG